MARGDQSGHGYGEFREDRIGGACDQASKKQLSDAAAQSLPVPLDWKKRWPWTEIATTFHFNKAFTRKSNVWLVTPGSSSIVLEKYFDGK
jgi:hypothetical protein